MPGRAPRLLLRSAAVLAVLLGVLHLVTSPAGAADNDRARQPTQPAVGPGGLAYPHTGFTETPGGFGSAGWWVLQPTGPTLASAPVAVIMHGFGEFFGHGQLDALVKHTARQGTIVIYPRYQVCPACPLPEMEPLLAEAVKGIRGALDWLRADPGRTQPRTDRTSYFGTSYGGMITVNLANRFASLGIPEPRAVVVDEPAGGVLGEHFDASLAGIPATTKVTCMVSEWFAANHRTIGCYLFWDRLAHLPDRNKDFALVFSDAHGTPDLVAKHGMAATYQPADAIDFHAVWKLWDAQRLCATTTTWCEYTNDTPQQRDMGKWTDGVPVTPMKISDTPLFS